MIVPILRVFASPLGAPVVAAVAGPAGVVPGAAVVSVLRSRPWSWCLFVAPAGRDGERHRREDREDTQ